MDEFDNQVECVIMAIRSVILSFSLYYIACFEDPRVWFACDAYAWIGFSVLEQYVISWLVLLDEVVFQQESILFAIYHHIFDICYMANQLACLARWLIFIEIAIDALV